MIAADNKERTVGIFYYFLVSNSATVCRIQIRCRLDTAVTHLFLFQCREYKISSSFSRYTPIFWRQLQFRTEYICTLVNLGFATKECLKWRLFFTKYVRRTWNENKFHTHSSIDAVTFLKYISQLSLARLVESRTSWCIHFWLGYFS